MTLTEKLDIALKDIRLNETRLVDTGGKCLSLTGVLANRARGMDFTFTVKMDKKARQYRVKKIKRGKRFKFTDFMVEQIKQLEVGQEVKVDTHGRTMQQAQGCSAYAAKKLGILISTRTCKNTGDKFIKRKF